jgi:hypothetical protein
MNIERIAEECNIFPSVNTDITLDELNLFAQKIREARDAEWMAEPVAYLYEDSCGKYKTPMVELNTINHTYHECWVHKPLFAKPKEVK